jgi:hypothetical protein
VRHSTAVVVVRGRDVSQNRGAFSAWGESGYGTAARGLQPPGCFCRVAEAHVQGGLVQRMWISSVTAGEFGRAR